MKDDSIEEYNFAGTTQQAMAKRCEGAEFTPEEVQHAFDRSCTLHCLEYVFETHGSHIPTIDRWDDYKKVLLEDGPHLVKGTNNSEIYDVNDGWYNHKIADKLLRPKGFPVVLQRLSLEQVDSNLDIALQNDRITSPQETELLQYLSKFGSEVPSESWFDAIKYTIDQNGYVVVSIRIPSSKVAGAVGKHSVLVTDVGDDLVTYFDSDELVTDRYGVDAPEQMIERVDSDALIYTQPKELFLARMGGEIMHIYPPGHTG